MSVLVVAEHRRGELRDPSVEALTAGRDLADAIGGDLHVAVIAGDVDRFAEELDREGVDAIHTVAHGEEFNHDVYAQAVEALAHDLDPTYLLSPNTVNGLDYAPAVAESLGWPLVTDAIDLAVEDGLVATREMYGSKVETTVARSTVTGFEEVGGGDVDIADADVLVSVGRGIEEEENVDLVEQLADALGATLSASRPIVDNEWLPKNRQVGQSGKVVTPDVYIAIGISGAVQHVAGMKGADTIVAINEDPSAPIFDVADYGIVDDLFDVVPALTAEFE
ncbi:electron transfer flavoprotein subunit alpha/FixB family protein [Halobacteriales archaeon SW_7_68_16]|nr:MAG: electron transfer flavoprotein subunit alpha/FixB family protein [Halobacteriales archaeon SW_7_68_16]